MQVTHETRTITLTAQDLAQIAGLPSPEQFQFPEGGQDVTAVIERTG